MITWRFMTSQNCFPGSSVGRTSLDNKEVRVLIGCNVPDAFWVLEERRGGKGEPVAIRSLLGWPLIGPTKKVKEESSSYANFVRLECERGRGEEAFLQEVMNFWKTDFANSLSSSKVPLSVEDERALTIMEDFVKKVSGHYQVALPWRQKPLYLPNNRVVVEHRLHLLKKRFLRDPEFFTRYKQLLMITSLKVTRSKCLRRSLTLMANPYGTYHTMPFFILTSQTSDIEAMFHQVKVNPKDADALRFLWWPDDDLSQQPIEYEMEVHLFGSTLSPSCANFSFRRTALKTMPGT